MRLFVAGANGRTGSNVVNRALDDGHEVTAFVRNDGPLRDDLPALRIVRGDVLGDREALEAALVGQDAVISALGNGLVLRGRPQNKIMAAAVANLVEAMGASEVRRVAVMMSFGAGHTRRTASTPIRLLGRTLLRKDFADLDAAAATLETSGLDWTVCYFGSLSDGPATTCASAGDASGTPRRLRIARADVARVLLDVVVADRFVQMPAVLSGCP